jgi:hypothetical protein
MGQTKSKLDEFVDPMSDEQAERILEWFDGEILNVDVDSHLRWLETGEGVSPYHPGPYHERSAPRPPGSSFGGGPLRSSVLALALFVPGLVGCYTYSPGALDSAGAHSRDPTLIGTDPDDVAEDLFFRKLGRRGHCLSGVVWFDHASGGPVGRALVVVRGRRTEPKEEQDFESATKTDDSGRFSVCVPPTKRAQWSSVIVREAEIRVDRSGVQAKTLRFLELDFSQEAPLAIFVAKAAK